MFVVRCVMELTRFPRAEATHKMWEAHHCGRSVLLTTYLERAELYADQFAERGLRVTVEPV
jgi:ATP-dependent Clp protease adapter protein ClpS